MKTNFLGLLAAAIFISLPASPAGAAPSDTNPPPRLTIELRDGSRVVGTSGEKNFKFHSALLGEIKLDVNAIRSVEFASTNTAKLVTAGGDSLTVTFVDSEFAVKTSFGKVALQASSVRRISVAAGSLAGAHPPGLVALWSGEGDGNDSVGGNNGTLSGAATFGPGKVGQGFVFDGRNGSGVALGNPAGLQLQDFTIEMWIKRGSDTVVSYGSGGVGTIFGCGWGGYYLLMESNGRLDFDRLGDVAAQPGPFITDTNFHHVALTKAGSEVVFYLDGTAYRVPSYSNTFTFTSSIGIGYRPDNQDNSFLGTLDEVQIYNRALSADEIRENYDNTK